MTDNAWTVVCVDGVVLRAPGNDPSISAWLENAAEVIAKQVAARAAEFALFGSYTVKYEEIRLDG